MGNEHSKAKGLQKRGTMNGHASIKANGFTANGGFSPTDEPSAVTSLEESIPPEYVIVEEGPPQTQGGADETDVGAPSVESEPTIPTKSSNKESASPAASRAKPETGNEPAAPSTAASDPPAPSKGMTIPPPPPPEPPRTEIKGEAAAKNSPKLDSKATLSGKVKAPKVSLSSFFSSKILKDLVEPKETTVEAAQAGSEIEPQQASADQMDVVQIVEKVVEVASQFVADDEKKVDPSKTGTLEAAAKPEPPALVLEEKLENVKFSFMEFFKIKPTGPIKATQSAPAPEPAPATKAKESPKVAVKSPGPPVEVKPAPAPPQAAEAVVNHPKKLEKRNSIGLFFKNLSQKRNSTDAGIQTESAPVAGAAEKSK